MKEILEIIRNALDFNGKLWFLVDSHWLPDLKVKDPKLTPQSSTANWWLKRVSLVSPSDMKVDSLWQIQMYTVCRYTWSKTSRLLEVTVQVKAEVKWNCIDLSLWKTGHQGLSLLAKLWDCFWTVFSSGDAYELLAERCCLELLPENTRAVSIWLLVSENKAEDECVDSSHKKTPPKK